MFTAAMPVAPARALLAPVAQTGVPEQVLVALAGLMSL